MRVYNGIRESSGTLIADSNPALVAETTTNGATFTGGVSEIWTLNNTGATPAQIVGSPQLLTNGTSHYMMATFTLNQPFTLYFVGKEITWVSNARIIGGATAECDLFQQNAGVSPNLKMYAGTTFAPLIGPALNINAILTAVFSGASSLFTLNAAAAQTGDIGTANPGGIILAAYRTLIAYGNIFSAGKAGTARWAIPYQDTDKDGKPVGTNWHIGVDERCRNVLVKDEIAQVLEWKEQPLSSL